MLNNYILHHLICHTEQSVSRLGPAAHTLFKFLTPLLCPYRPMGGTAIGLHWLFADDSAD